MRSARVGSRRKLICIFGAALSTTPPLSCTDSQVCVGKTEDKRAYQQDDAQCEQKRAERAQQGGRSRRGGRAGVRRARRLPSGLP